MKQEQDYRIFVGAFPQGEIAARIQAIREHYDPVTARITAPHVTLAGTYWRRGPATPEQEAATITRLQALSGELPAVPLHLGGIALFAPTERPVIYLQIELTPALLAVRAALLSVLGRDKHHHFTPHLTLAMRLKGPTARRMLDELHQSEWHSERWSVPIAQLAFMQRGPTDPAWREIGQVKLNSE